MPELCFETIYKIWCPKCDNPSFVNNGDTQDLTVPDIGGVECPYCKFCYKLNPEFDDNDEESIDYVLGQKQLS